MYPHTNPELRALLDTIKGMRKVIALGVGAVVIVLIGILVLNPQLVRYLKNQVALLTGSITLEEELKPALFVAPLNGGVYTSNGKNVTRGYLPKGTVIIDAARSPTRLVVVSRLPDGLYGIWTDGILRTSSATKKNDIDVTPNGYRVAYVEEGKGTSSVILLTADGVSQTIASSSQPLFLSDTVIAVSDASGVALYALEDLTKAPRRVAVLGTATALVAASPDRSFIAAVDEEKGQTTVYRSINPQEGLFVAQSVSPYLAASSLILTPNALYVLTPPNKSLQRGLFKYSFDGGAPAKLRSYDGDMYITKILP